MTTNADKRNTEFFLLNTSELPTSNHHFSYTPDITISRPGDASDSDSSDWELINFEPIKNARPLKFE
jgi:hypothetical protein